MPTGIRPCWRTTAINRRWSRSARNRCSPNIDGLILTERTHTPRTLKMIEVAGIPVVELMDSQSPCLDIAVGFDNFEAARQMTAAIIARGHRHIAYLGARLDERTIIKQKGYEQAMRDAGRFLTV